MKSWHMELQESTSNCAKKLENLNTRPDSQIPVIFLLFAYNWDT